MADYSRQIMAIFFPDLAEDPNFEVLSEPDDTYNCIAWAMGFNDRWVDQYCDAPGHWWPTGVKPGTSADDLIHAFEAVGFTKTEDGMPEQGYSKVVLYKKPDRDEWTHAARIVSETKEYSKFGQKWDATHSHNVLCNTGLGFEDSSYGEAYAFMKRPDPYDSKALRLSGSVEVDVAELKKHGLI
ncbi:MAG: hypothetical protein LUC24_00145 [Bacteroidales bacterium]|nr:hypothetical protein [Bacteroidales bacterium]